MAEPIVITSFDDPRVDVYRDVRDADLRGREKLFMAESELVVRRLMRTPERLHSLLLTPTRAERMHAEIAALPESVPVYVTDLGMMSQIAAFYIHRGVLAAGYRPNPAALSLDHVLAPWRDVNTALTIIAAEGMTNVDNMGGIFRNAAAFGVDAVVLDPTCCDPLYRKAIRVSMGHALSVPFAQSTDWAGDLKRLKREWGTNIVGIEVTPSAEPLWRIPHHERLTLVFGSEGKGLSAATLECCDVVCQIPMREGVPSLNVATASAVVLYELNRQRRT